MTSRPSVRGHTVGREGRVRDAIDLSVQGGDRQTDSRMNHAANAGARRDAHVRSGHLRHALARR